MKTWGKKRLIAVLYGISRLLTVCLLFLDIFCLALWLEMISAYDGTGLMYSPAAAEDIWFFGSWTVGLTVLIILSLVGTNYLGAKQKRYYEDETSDK